MKVLVIGSGGREHALVWALSRSKRVTELVCAPGNGGIARLARCVPVDMNDGNAMLRLVDEEQPGLVVVGPELPLSLGLVDKLQKKKVRVFGPTRDAAQLESSKEFAKEFMVRHGIPTAAYSACSTVNEVRKQLRTFPGKVVVKADGLAAGKGVVICDNSLQAEQTAAAMFSGELLGTPVETLVLEEFLTGDELSFFALCDGRTAMPLAAAQDHKRIGEGDTGPNTGGMGAYSTGELLGAEMRLWLLDKVAQRTVNGMASERTPFQGILFCGLMMVPLRPGVAQPMVLEFNTRFGDPETQAILMRLDSDLLDLLEAAVDGRVSSTPVRVKPGASVCVIAASAGYPGKYTGGEVIHGLDSTGQVQDLPEDVQIFHSGTVLRDGQYLTAGGRVLGVTGYSALGLKDALAKVYAVLEKISFEGMQYRRDIGWRALQDEAKDQGLTTS